MVLVAATQEYSPYLKTSLLHLPSVLAVVSLSTPKTPGVADKMDLKDKLQLFSIFYEERALIPTVLEQHILNLRKLRQALSLNAKQIQELVPVARSRSK
jgi:hypothetical protein